eukprot:gene17738-biopygen8533
MGGMGQALDSQWISNGLPMDPQWIPDGFPMDSQWIPNGSPMDAQWIPNGFPLDAQWILNGCPMDPQWIPTDACGCLVAGGAGRDWTLQCAPRCGPGEPSRNWRNGLQLADQPNEHCLVQRSCDWLAAMTERGKGRNCKQAPAGLRRSSEGLTDGKGGQNH